MSSGGVWRVGPLQAHVTVVTKRFFLILGALLVLGDVGSVVFAVSYSSAITAAAILIALASAFALTAATEFKAGPDNARRDQSDLATSARLPLPAAGKAMASSASNGFWTLQPTVCETRAPKSLDQIGTLSHQSP